MIPEDDSTWTGAYSLGARGRAASTPSLTVGWTRKASELESNEVLGAGLSWEDLSWYTEVAGAEEKRVLHDLRGCVPAGQLMAVLGPSGSGKTTLLDILAMRKTVGRTAGFVRVNGQERKPKDFQRASAFILQHDVLLPTLTVAETMWYYAEVLLPSKLTAAQKNRRIDEVLREVGLHKAGPRLVGGAGDSGLHGLSSGERKRLSIAASMLLKPVLVFADEPTTGIDAYASLKVVEVLKALALSGKVVVVTLHQPRTAVWMLFDQLYLMSEGRLMFSGPPTSAPTWFESLGFHVPTGQTVADWLLDVVTIGFDKESLGGKSLQTTADVEAASASFRSSTWAEVVEAEIAAAVQAAWSAGLARVKWPMAAALPGKARVPRYFRLRALLYRHCLNYVRNVGNVVARLLLALVAGCLVGICYLELRNQDGSDASTLQNRFGSIFFCCFILMMSPNCSMGLFVSDRRFYSVEAAACLYDSLSYYLPFALCETMVNIAAATLFWTPVCILSGAGHKSFVGYIRGLAACSLMQLCGSQITCFSAMLLPNQELAFVLSVGMNVVAFITGGFLIKTRNLPSTLAWLRNLSPVKFGFHVLALNEVLDSRFETQWQLDRLDTAFEEVAYQGCVRDDVQIRGSLRFLLRRPDLQHLRRSVMGDVLDSVDPCLFGSERTGEEALVCWQLDEPYVNSSIPSILVLLLQLVLLHVAGWLCLRYLHKERR